MSTKACEVHGLGKRRISPNYGSIHFPFVLITSDLAAVVRRPSRMASSSTSAARSAVYRRCERKTPFAPSIHRAARGTGGTTSHSTRPPNNSSQVAGYQDERKMYRTIVGTYSALP